ncbi:unnamed protein product [Spirodela intermedia]|uniref:Uncharacterized protein n=2 Tax=Spirodela intermedia TaxID=51605 RepID=A0A7I8I7B3_SPIIN|nr:unnamed protein product [Spirodela intermedia]CAA6653457.1 unnamed protein product [Spirodela intermedia]CAA7387680.1 unnamed protein product [Spirodela intermedia]
MKSGRKRERPSESMSLGPRAPASSRTCQLFCCAMAIHWYEYLAPVTLDCTGKTKRPTAEPWPPSPSPAGPSSSPTGSRGRTW